jgi:enoyl-CoA hydratase
VTNDDPETIRREMVGDVLVVTIDHPTSRLNTVDHALHTQLGGLFRELKREERARAVLLTGRDGVFSAGGDFRYLEATSTMALRDRTRRDGRQLVWDLLDVEIPIVAAVDGPAIGLGASVALLCDVIFASDRATFADPHVRVGITAGDGGTAIWPLAIGPARAKQYLMTGDPVAAAEAERIGLINQVVPADDLHDVALAFATRLAAGAPLAVRATKMAVNKLVKDALNIAFDVAMASEIVTFFSDDHVEAIKAIREKRPPAFKGS